MGGTVYIALPAFGQTCTTHTVFSLMEVTKALVSRGWDYQFADYSFPDIADARDLMTTIWFDNSDAEWMLQVDADMRFPWQLVTDMLDFGAPVMGCLYPKKKYPIEFVGTAYGMEKTIRDGFMNVGGIGFGVAMIHRSAIVAMLASGQARSHTSEHGAGGRLHKDFGINRIIKAFRRIELDSGDDLSEDFSFCRRHIASGGEVWANIKHRILHVGQHAYAGSYADAVAAHPVRSVPPVQFHRTGKAGDGGLLPARAVRSPHPKGDELAPV